MGVDERSMGMDTGAECLFKTLFRIQFHARLMCISRIRDVTVGNTLLTLFV